MGNLEANQQSADRSFEAFSGQGARLRSQRRFEAKARGIARGVNIAKSLHAEVLLLAK